LLLAWHRRPGIDVGFKRDIVVSGDKRLSLETLSLRPVVLSVAGFLEDGECDHIISTAKPFVKASEVKLMDKDKGKAAKEFRTSSTHFLNSRYYKFLRPIDERVANLTRTPLESQEDAQVLRYLEGQYYLSHHDFFDPVAYRNGEMFNNINAGHLNRLLTVFWYMTDADGGYTVRSFAWRGDLTSCCVFVCLFQLFHKLELRIALLLLLLLCLFARAGLPESRPRALRRAPRDCGPAIRQHVPCDAQGAAAPRKGACSAVAQAALLPPQICPFVRFRIW